jgi:hypothetical protein
MTSPLSTSQLKVPRELKFGPNAAYLQLDLKNFFKKNLGFGTFEINGNNASWTTKKVGKYELNFSTLGACCGAESCLLILSENYSARYLEAFLSTYFEYRRIKGYVLILVDNTYIEKVGEALEKVCGPKIGTASTKTMYQKVIPFVKGWKPS